MSNTENGDQEPLSQNEILIGKELKNVAKILKVSSDEQTVFLTNLASKPSIEREKAFREQLVSRLGDCDTQDISKLVACAQNYIKLYDELLLPLTELVRSDLLNDEQRKQLDNDLNSKSTMKSRTDFMQSKVTELKKMYDSRDKKGNKLWLGLTIAGVILVGGGVFFWYTRRNSLKSS